MSWFEIWFWKPIMEFFGAMALVLAGIALIILWALFDVFVLSRYKTWKLKRFWKKQSREWRVREYARKMSSSNMQNWPTSWQREMVEEDKKQ